MTDTSVPESKYGVPRKIVALAAIPATEDMHAVICALADDGSCWMGQMIPTTHPITLTVDWWQRLPPLPQVEHPAAPSD